MPIIEPTDTTSDTGLPFLMEWLRAPRQIGAIAPSGRHLAAAMTDDLCPACAPVIELGPGTGVFTEAFLRRGVPAQRVAAVELNNTFATGLAARFPDIQVLRGDATRLAALSPFGPGGAHRVICGLPLRSMAPKTILRILSGSFANLAPGGELRLFTYGLGCPVPASILDRLDLRAKRKAFILRNAPPAAVFSIQRRGPALP
ncbi:SAM-dependent methyltransferase [Jannaschia pagri]|uniref:SAM-dependent methyltransferase n=1 Tax=Jannaschia pagri TaxID=2829797 RepID=A0ABQ4NRH3_9RHOB|nr:MULTISPECIES: methyltransferase domain-containing protein [unclassified Jannaschia]GIT93223.1 SAM-dependent methyltransferase [Jannaschia sp. AI_61]GIT97010.1 SAM-dependent methyltransferase [Jannaschia sp. AI_62]